MSTLYANTLVLKGNPSVELTAQTASKSNVSILKSDEQLTFSGNGAQAFAFEPAASSSLSYLVEYDDVSKDFTFKKGAHIISAQVHVTRPLCTLIDHYVGVVNDGAVQNTTVTDNSAADVKVPYVPDPTNAFTRKQRPYIVDPIRVELRAKSGANIIGQSTTYLSPTISGATSGNSFVEPVTFNLILDLTADKVVTFEINVLNKAAQTSDLFINSLMNTSLMHVNSFSS